MEHTSNNPLSFLFTVAVTGYKTFYGVLGGSVSLSISKPPNIKLHDMKWLKGKKLLQQIKLEGTNSTYSDRYHLFLNGTLKISGLQMEDDGVYIAEAYDAAGKAIPIEPVAVRVTGESLKATPLPKQGGEPLFLFSSFPLRGLLSSLYPLSYTKRKPTKEAMISL